MKLGAGAPRHPPSPPTRRNVRSPAVRTCASGTPSRPSPLRPQTSERKLLAKEAFRKAQRQDGTLPAPTQFTIPQAIPPASRQGTSRQGTRRTPDQPPQALYLPSPYPHTTPADLAEALGITPAAAAKLLTKAPVLREVPAQQLHEALVYLVLLLGAPQDAILRLAWRHPDALTMPQSAKQADKLGFMCYLQQRPRLLEALTHASFLDSCRPNCFLHQVCHISVTLEVTLEAAMDMLVACPSLIALTQPPGRLPSLAARLAAELDLQDPHLLRSCLMQAPHLLLEAAAGDGAWEQLQERAAWLRRHGLTGRPLAAVPRLLLLGVPALEGAVQQLQQLLDLPLDAAVKLAARMPLLLITSRGTLDTRLAALERLLELDPAAARQLAAAGPRLLTDRAGATHACLLLLRQLLSLDGERLQVLVAGGTQLLTHPSRLRGNCLALVHAATMCSHWRMEVARMPLSSLPWVLEQPELHTRRLLYLLRTRRSRTTSLVAALAAPDDEFAAAYPGYAAWRRYRLPPLKLERPQVAMFRALVRAMPLRPEPLPVHARRRVRRGPAGDEHFDADDEQ